MFVAQKTHIVYIPSTPSKLKLIKQVTKVRELKFPLYSASLLFSGEIPPRVLCPALGAPAQD